ncbi:DUF2326 domain-containing protein [Xanthomonas arboricola]|uniref:DUF2326 domain-containing protein n=1 Tax=Xanthomonas arboricola TaxID=56448 RepID=UPI000F8F5ABE|nr:DUF2326 domain-containing protein [Xanthomonas arboricola]
MFLKSLRIENKHGVIRDIEFHAGLNLIVDETPADRQQSTGNNVGKTTVLRLIDLCLGGNPKRIYTDPENPKSEYTEVKRFLIDTDVHVTLTLRRLLTSESDGDLVIERNFLARRKIVRLINGKAYSEADFEAALRSHLFPNDSAKKPTFRQIISHNIRYKEPALSNTLRTLDDYTRKDEYEALYLFLLGAAFDDGDRKQELTARLRTETVFKQRLERRHTRAELEISLGMLLEEIKDLESRRATFKRGSEVDSQLSSLTEVKYFKGSVAADLAKASLRRELVQSAVSDLGAKRSSVDAAELRSLYDEVSGHLGELTKSFEELLSFHNRMVEEKVRYVSKELPDLERIIAEREREMRRLNQVEESLVVAIAESGTFEDMEAIVLALNDSHRRRGEYEVVISQLGAVDESIATINEQLATIDRQLFSEESSAAIHSQLVKFNRHFSAVSEELYGEKYALKVERIPTKDGHQAFEFSCFNTNFSSGKKQGEITCFDIAYTRFADEQQIPCYHFLLYDKKELVHDNQLERIGRLVAREGDQVQFVASILRDKLPSELDKEEYFVVKLSQTDKLFRIESQDDKDGDTASDHADIH